MAKKRAHGDGSLYKRKDGRWCGQYTVQTSTGPKLKYVYARTKAEAAAKLRKAMADRDAGLHFADQNQTLGDYLDRWLSNSVRGSVKKRTFERYEEMVRIHIKPLLGTKKLGKLRPADVQHLYRERLDSGLSAGTVRHVHVTLHKAPKRAVQWNLVPTNVTEAVDVPKASKEEPLSLSVEQVKALLEATKGERFEALFVLAVHTGMRQGELLGLKWDDVDFERGEIHVKRTLVAGKGGFSFGEPKSAKGRRTVALTPAALEALEHHRERQREESVMMVGLWEENGLVFPNRLGKPMDHNNIYHRDLKRVRERAGLPPALRFHDLRHTFATLMLSNGESLNVVQETLGHSQASTTLDVYGHVLPNHQKQAMSRLGELLS
jgi:integrase